MGLGRVRWGGRGGGGTLRHQPVNHDERVYGYANMNAELLIRVRVCGISQHRRIDHSGGHLPSTILSN